MVETEIVQVISRANYRRIKRPCSKGKCGNLSLTCLITHCGMAIRGSSAEVACGIDLVTYRGTAAAGPGIEPQFPRVRI